MKLKNSFFYTMREDVKNEDSISGNLLVKSGMIKKEGAGTYSFMPLGFKVLKKIEELVRTEMNTAGAEEVLMPSLIHEEVYESTGRSQTFGSSIFRLKDRFGRPYILGPTHEELFTNAAKGKVKSYKDLPFNIYQFQNKFRDEPRPRYGLIRVREFIMKDAYSFDKDLNGLNVSYEKMFNAYKNIFDKLNIDYKIVKSDTGAMGGLLSEEFQAISEIGEDTLVICNSCGYGSNIDIAECLKKDNIKEEQKELESTETKDMKTIEEVSNFLKVSKDKIVKTLIYKYGKEYVACLIRGDRKLNETKLMKILNASSIEPATDEEVKEITNAEVGFAGPIGLDIKVLADLEVSTMNNFVVGANKTDYHYINCNNNRDFDNIDICDIRNIELDDKCPQCGAQTVFTKGIEIGNTFKLGTKYSEALGLNYLDQNNKLNPVIMGSYGIGIGRTMAAIVEQNNDAKGIIWPTIIAPYQVIIVLINNNDEQQVKVANDLYDELNNLGIETILDDRDERPGVKFNDSELIGIPIRITVGKKSSEGIVEYKERKSDAMEEISINDIIGKINKN